MTKKDQEMKSCIICKFVNCCTYKDAVLMAVKDLMTNPTTKQDLSHWHVVVGDMCNSYKKGKTVTIGHWYPDKEITKHSIDTMEPGYKCSCGATLNVKDRMVYHESIG